MKVMHIHKQWLVVCNTDYFQINSSRLFGDKSNNIYMFLIGKLYIS